MASLFLCVIVEMLLIRVSSVTFGAAQRVFLSSNNLTPCYNDTVDLICHYPDVMERVNEQLRYSVTIPSWRMDGWVIFPDEDVFSQGPINQTASRLRVRTDPAIFTGDPVSFTCYLLLSSGGEDSASTVVKPQASPNPPVITTINSFYTSISLYWTHDKTCFENVTVKFHVQLNTGTQPVVTDQLMAEIGGIISGRNYTISVMAVVDDTQRSEPDRENLRAGFPTISEQVPHCFGRPYKLTCHYHYETNISLLWLINGTQVEHDGQEFDISDTDRSLTLLDVSQSRYAENESAFHCCVELTGGPRVCGERYLIDALEQPEPPTAIAIANAAISLTWSISKSCSGYGINIFWESGRDSGHAMNVSENSFIITDLTPGVTYNITLVAIDNRLRSDSISISATTLSNGKLTEGELAGIALASLVVFAMAVVIAVAVAVIVYKRKGTHGIYDVKTDV